MGNSVSSSLAGCLVPITAPHSHQHSYPYLCTPSDEGLGHSFCYIRPIPESPVHLSPTYSHPSIQDDPSSTNHIQANLTDISETSKSIPETTFRSISGASVSANTSTPCTIACNEQPSFFAKVPDDRAAAFESTPSFTALPLQPIPKGSNSATFSGPISSSFERGLMFGPFERGFMSGPLERSSMSGPMESSFDHTYFSAPLPGYSRNYTKKKRKTIARFLSTVSKPVKAVLNGTAWKKSMLRDNSTCDSVYAAHHLDSHNLQWAQGKAGEDRVHVVLSERHGWLFVGIYDGFNGPDAPDFLMRNLYPAIYKELQGLLWGEDEVPAHWRGKPDVGRETKTSPYMNREAESFKANGSHNDCCFFKSSRLAQPQTKGVDAQHNAILRHKIGVSIPDGFSDKGFKSKTSAFMDGHTETKEIDSALPCKDEWECAGQKAWPVKDQKPYKKNDIDHSAVLRALAQALEDTEEAYLDMANQALDENPELALMGSCILVMLMKDEDVYIMNVGDSRAIIAQQRSRPLQSIHSSKTSNIDDRIGLRDSMLRLDLERIIEETPTELEAVEGPCDIHCYKKCQSNALQLSSDHSTSIEEEICRIRAEHPDDKFSILNDRVKGTLKVTRAFGAGFLKKPQWNNAILETFRIDYVGSAPYISCTPALHHHRLCPNDRFLILSSDGLYQYLTNKEVVYEVECFMERFPEGDPAQHLIEEVLFRAAKKAGMDFHELLDIPQGDRRKYHDDVSVMVISLEGRMWRSSS